METKRKSAKVVVSVLALAGLAVFSLFAVGGSLEPSAPPGPTMKTLDEVEPRKPITQDDIPLTITESGSYYLTSDVNSAGTAITVNVNDVTIDLMGYSLTGPGLVPGPRGILITGRSNVEVRNGTVRAFDLGIDDCVAGNAHRIICVRAVSNRTHGISLSGYGHLVKDCTAAGNGQAGISAQNGCTVTGNTAYNNTGGIAASGGSTIIGNTAYNNQSTGIGAFTGCTVTGNTAYGNQPGIYVYSDCLVKGNTVKANNQNNIYVYSSDNAIEENLVTDCTGNGIYFNSTGNFYANNRASGNGTDYANTAGQTDGGGNYSF